MTVKPSTKSSGQAFPELPDLKTRHLQSEPLGGRTFPRGRSPGHINDVIHRLPLYLVSGVGTRIRLRGQIRLLEVGVQGDSKSAEAVINGRFFLSLQKEWHEVFKHKMEVLVPTRRTRERHHRV